MKVTKITFEQLFPTGQYANQRLGIEIDIDDYDFRIGEQEGKDKQEVVKTGFEYAKKLVNEAFQALNPDLTSPIYEQETPTTEIQVERRIGALAEDILSSPDMKTLESYKLIVRAKPELQEAYDKRLEELLK